jgi:hypothetical protein
VITILNFLNGVKPDPLGEASTTVSRLMSKLGLSRDEVYIKVMEAQKKGLIHFVKSLEPVSFDMMDVGITGRGRSYLKQKYYDQMRVSRAYSIRARGNLGVGPI